MSVGQPKLVAAIGVINGINKEFQTPTEYIPGTTKIFHNGVLLDQTGGPDYDGWFEESDNQTITLNFAPETDDTLFIYYEDVSMSGGMPGGLPKIISADDLKPIIKQLINLRPRIISSKVE